MSARAVRRAILVCANDTQVHTLAPVATSLRAVGVEPVVLSLDPFYDQGASEVARGYSLEAREPQWRSRRDQAAFYRRPFPLIWRDVITARGPLDLLLLELNADRLVMGNDFGLIEKLLILRSKALGVPKRVLVQDGQLSRERPAESGLLRRAFRAGKSMLSPLLAVVGLSYLASSNYGEGGCEVICASGTRSSLLLAARARGHSRVVVTGQPRYDRLVDFTRRESRDRVESIGVFTTPFAAAGYGDDVQRGQEQFVGALFKHFRKLGIGLVVKPHPREEIPRYWAHLPPENVTTIDPAQLLADVDVAVIGASTLVEEAALVGCPVIVPGSVIHGRRFEGALPSQSAFPRFETPDQAVHLVGLLESSVSRTALVERQRTEIAAAVKFEPHHRAADAVARAILAA